MGLRATLPTAQKLRLKQMALDLKHKKKNAPVEVPATLDAKQIAVNKHLAKVAKKAAKKAKKAAKKAAKAVSKHQYLTPKEKHHAKILAKKAAKKAARAAKKAAHKAIDRKIQQRHSHLHHHVHHGKEVTPIDSDHVVATVTTVRLIEKRLRGLNRLFTLLKGQIGIDVKPLLSSADRLKKKKLLQINIEKI